MSVNTMDREKHIPRQLPLNTYYELLVVALVNVLHCRAGESRVEEARGQARGRRRRKRSLSVRIPQAITGNRINAAIASAAAAINGPFTAGIEARQSAIQIVSVVDCDFVDAVFEGTRIQPIPGYAAQQNSLAIQLVGKPDTRAEMVPEHVHMVPANTERARGTCRAELRHSTQ